MKTRGTILKEFALYCERPVNDRERTLEDRSRSIMSSTSAFFKRDIRTDGYWKIGIYLNSTNPLQHLKVGGGVLMFNTEFDVDKFFSLDISGQKDCMLEFVINTLSDVFRTKNLDCSRLSDLRKFIIDREFKSKFTSRSSAYNDLTACVVCEQGFEVAEVFLSIRKGKKEIDKILLISTSPEEFAFNIYLKPPEWLSATELRIVAANGEVLTTTRAN